MSELDDLPSILSERVRLEAMTLGDLDALSRIADVPAVTEKMDVFGQRVTRAMGEEVKCHRPART